MNWDSYFLGICNEVSKKSPCLSRKIGALIVRDNYILATGFNGPPRKTPHCGYDRAIKDQELNKLLQNKSHEEFGNICPRKALGYSSGTHMDLCPAQHAEENAITTAAANGVSVKGSTCYLNTVIPCQKCFGTLINAGIVEVVVVDLTVYDKYTQFLIDFSNIKIRLFS
jgi:dCMP deaminase